jgi:hypothetical protein
MVNAKDLLEQNVALRSRLDERDVQLCERDREIEKLRAYAQALEARNVHLVNHCEVLRKLVFGPSSEKRRPTKAAPGAFLPFAEILSADKRVAEEKEAEVTVEVKAHTVLLTEISASEARVEG